MSQEDVANFAAITGADPARAQQYLDISDGNINQAVQLWYETGGIDLMETTAATAPAPVPVPDGSPQQVGAGGAPREVIEIPSDDEMEDNDSDGGLGGVSGPRAASNTTARPPPASSTEDDEALARRLQQEMYGGGPGEGGGRGAELDADGVRAPIARTTETLVGPDLYDLSNPSDRAAAVADQMFRRAHARRTGGL